MKDLFITKPEFEKDAAAKKYLGQDHSTWVKDIITQFLAEYPTLQNEILTVTWEKTDFKKGYATGKLNIPAANVTVPLIIQDWILFPLDVINKGGVFLPLNAHTVEEVFLSSTPFNLTKSYNPKTELTLFGEGKALQFSPTGESSPTSYSDGNSQTRDAVKVAFIEHINNVDKDDLNLLLTKLANKNVQRLFKANGTEQILDKFEEIKIASSSNKIEDLVRDLDIDISYVYEDQDGNFILKQANSEIDYVWETEVNEKELDGLKIKAVENELEVVKTSSYKIVEVEKDVFEIGDKGYFKHENIFTPKELILDIVKVADTSEKYNSYKILNDNRIISINSENNYFITDRLNKTASEIDVNSVEPKVGDKGIFVCGNTSTQPVEIISIYKSAKAGEYEIIGYDGFSKIGFYPIKTKNIEFQEMDKIASYISKGFYVSGETQFIKLNKDLSKLAEYTEEFLIEKVANKVNGILNIHTSKNVYTITSDVDKITQVDSNSFLVPVDSSFIADEKIAEFLSVPKSKNIAGRDSAGLYFFNGSGFNKYSNLHPIRDLELNEAVWTLLHCRGNETDIKKLASLNKGEDIVLTSNIHSPITVNELSKILEEKNNFIKSSEFIDDVVKLASALKDESTVDAVLSLGLINDKNLLEYVSMIPNYEAVLSELSELLLMARLGLSGVQEEPIAETIEALSQVLKSLKEIKGVTNLK